MKSRQQKNQDFRTLVAETYSSGSPIMDEEEEVIEIEMGPPEVVDDTFIEFEDEVEPDPEIMSGVTPHPDNDNVIAGDLIRAQDAAQRLQELCSEIDPDNWMVAKIAKATDYIDEVLKRMEAKATNNCGCE